MSWRRFAPKQWTKAHLRLFKRLNKENINFISEEPVKCGTDGTFQVDILISPNLIVEVWGDSHKRERRREKDEWKDSMLKKHGYTVLHYWDTQINKELDWVITKIRKNLKT